MNHYPYIASRLFNTPLMIHPGKLHAIIAGLSDRLGVIAPPEPQAYTAQFGTRQKGGYRLLENGVAVLEVFGVLAHRGRMQADSSYIQGYDGLARALDGALADPNVGAILLEIDSPGGEVSGAFQLAEQIRKARAVKPIAAVAGDMAASAAYLIASAADSVSVTPTGRVGSIGVVTSHVDMSRAVDRMGFTVTYIYAGAHKIDGNPLQPLPESVAADIQADIDHYYGLFVHAVAGFRDMDPDALRATEARMFIGATATTVGLADRVETPDQAIARLADQIRKPSGATRARGQSMSFFNFGKKRLNLDISVSEAPDADPPESEPETSPADPPAPEPETLSAVAIAQGCAAAGMPPALAALILKTPHTAEQFEARIAAAKAVRAVCETARVPELADGLIAEGATEESAMLATWNALVARSEKHQIDATPPDRKSTVRRAEFDAMPPSQRRDFVVAGGQIVE